MAVLYLGAYQGALLVERDGIYYKQYNGWGFVHECIEAEISRKEIDRVIALGRDEYDMALVTGSDNISAGATPV